MQVDGDFEHSQKMISEHHFSKLRKDMQDHISLFQSQGVVCATQVFADCMISEHAREMRESWTICAAQAGCNTQQLTAENKDQVALRLN